jgi:hypothetical protein
MSKFNSSQAISMSSVLALVAIVCVIGFAACGCYESASEYISYSDFIGKYKADFGSAEIDEIEFRTGSTYVHLFQQKNGPLLADTGRYEFQSLAVGKKYWVRFPRFVLLAQQDLCFDHIVVDPTGKRVVCVTPVVMRNGSGMIVKLCPDELLYYVKVK